jgi:NADH-quinone oxidoreductase subunit N
MIAALVLLATALAVLAAGTIAPRRAAGALRPLALLGVAVAAAPLGAALARPTPGGDALTTTMALAILAGAFLALVLGIDGPERDGSSRGGAEGGGTEGATRGVSVMGAERHFFTLLATAALLVAAETPRLPLLFVAVATVSVSMAFAAPLRGGRLWARVSTSVLFGGLACAFLSLGAALLFGATRELHLDDIGTALRMGGAGDDLPLLVAGLALLGAGSALLLGAFPFHAWAEGLRDRGSPVATAMVELSLKGAGAAILLRLARLAAEPPDAGVWVGLAAALGALALAALGVGATRALCGAFPGGALRETSPSRAKARGEIAEILGGASAFRSGLLVAAAVAGAWTIETHPGEGANPAAPIVLLVLSDGIALLGLSAALGSLGGSAGRGLALDDLRGLLRSDPHLALSVVVLVLSLAGLPPTAGFWGRLWLLSQAEAGGGLLPSLLGIAAAVALAGGLFPLATAVFLDRGREAAPPRPEENGARTLAIICALLLLFWGVFPETLLGLANAAGSR